MSYRGKEKQYDGIPLYNGEQGTSDNKRFNWKPSLIKTLRFPLNLKPHIHQRDVQVIGSVFLFWVLVVHAMERTYIRYTMNKCKWSKWDKQVGGETSHKVAIIADPQLVDDNSYPGQPAIINYLVKQLSDNYLHRNYRYMQHMIDPDTILFLGDLFDGGREWGDKLWFDEYDRFNRIFPKEPTRRTIQSVPGNHDIGFENIDHDHLKRFSAFFGPLNDFIEIGNHSIILLDSISLSSQDEKIKQPADEFLSNVMSLTHESFPKILLTHVPLYRINNRQLCGPRRESKNLFPVQKGKQYQTVIDSELSLKILETIKPVLVFSGDDHDYCEITHDIPHTVNKATEITVKSAAMTAGVKYPAIQLLSLHNPIDSTGNLIINGPTFSTEMCYFPDPYFSIEIYILSSVVSLIILGLNFLTPQLLDKILFKFWSKTQDNISLPFFTSVSTNKEVGDNRVSNKSGFSLAIIITATWAISVIGVYYRNV